MSFDFGRIPGKKSFADDYISTIRMNVAKYPNKTAVIFGDRTMTWTDVWENSNRLGHALLDLGLNRHDRVLILLPNCPEYPEVVLGINKAACVATACNFRLTAPEVAYQLNDCGARAVILKSAAELETVLSVKDQVPSLEHVIMVENSAPEGVFDYKSLLAQAPAEEPGVETDPSDVHLLMYTSGTTGKPKAAARTYKSDYHMANAVIHELGLTPDDVYLAAAPMYAAASMGYTFSTMMSAGTLAILPAFIPDQIFPEIERVKATWIFMVPIMYEWMLTTPADVLGASDVSSVRHVVSCGAPLHNATAKKMIDSFTQAKVSNWLGASEFGFISRYTYENGPAGEGCVGRPVFDLELAVFDEEGNRAAVNEPGVLYGRGYSMWEGYLNKPEATKEAFLDHEWGTVGDICRQGEDGDFYIVDRKNDMIITGGMNVYPVEIENVLMAHEAVADVAVIGVPDEKWGEAVKALVVKAQGSEISEDDLIAYCKENMAGFKTPKSVEFIDQVPRSMIGKALKAQMRKKYWEGKDTVI
ncbi:AMP-dependent CoA ligase/synthetase [Desulfatibacillum aliphaticivorans]|uniref:AMP-dependent CoA ligase/synthetase n=1 Tax=Desulfatibacillum aliphaticivorans TaxID=218208 RepID=B8FK03_DESAL|nr:class I adenylate-forming enzyme family protein [Desulfatibacillum aliphaticivorans]ACL02431.1 AMP-dependent CoA ligase/synthetase [Desulfatibacillum aliphaticivorans]